MVVVKDKIPVQIKTNHNRDGPTDDHAEADRLKVEENGGKEEIIDEHGSQGGPTVPNEYEIDPHGIEKRIEL